VGGLGLYAGGVGSGSFSSSLGTDFNIDALEIEAICSPSVSTGGVRCDVVVS